MNQKGGMVVLLLPVTLMLFVTSIFLVDIGRGCLVAQRSQTWADAAVLASLRVRDKELRVISNRWEAVQGLFTGATESAALVPADDWADVSIHMNALREAVSGYAARIRSIIPVVTRANGGEPADAQITTGDALALGITAQPQWIEDESRNRKILPALWYKREWGAAERLAHPNDIGAIGISRRLRLLGAGLIRGVPQTWKVDREAKARLRWDVALEELEIQDRGNGGYPRSWTEAINEGRLIPFRFPVYRAELTRGEE